MAIERFRGDTKPVVVTLMNGGVPLNLTGCTNFVMTADPEREPTTSAANIFSITGSISGDPLVGMIEFLPSAIEMDHVGNFYFDVQYSDARGFTTTAGKDKLILKQDITK